MAGTAVVASTTHRPAGMKRTKVRWIGDASGVASATEVNVGYGRLVAVTLPVSVNRRGSLGNAIVTVKYPDGGAILTYDTDGMKFGSTTTGDTAGGAATNLFTTGANHLLSAGDVIKFFSISQVAGGTQEVVIDTEYFVTTGASLTATTFQLSGTAALGIAGTDLELGTNDITAASWVKVANADGTPSANSPYFRPSKIISDIDATDIAGHANNPNVNRDVYVYGTVKVSVAQAGNLGEGQIEFIVDELELGTPNVQ